MTGVSPCSIIIPRANGVLVGIPTGNKLLNPIFKFGLPILESENARSKEWRGVRPCDGLLTKCSCHGDHRCPSQALWGHGQPCVVIYQSRSGLPPCGSGTAPGQKKTACWSQFSILLYQSPFFEAGLGARLQKSGFDTIGSKIEGRRPKSSVFAG